MSIISNTTVLSNFAAVNKVELLHQLYQRLYMPTAVYDEIRRGLDEGYAFYNALIGHVYPLNDNGWIHLTSVSGEVELRALARLPRKIHSGEAECLAIAKQRQWLLLTDDRAAREAAHAWGIPLSGTLGSLVLAVERSYCSLEQANTYLSLMIQQGYRSFVVDLSTLLL